MKRQARRTDRSQLRLIHCERDEPEDELTPPYLAAAVVAGLILGAMLLPLVSLAFAGVWLAAWLAGVGR